MPNPCHKFRLTILFATVAACAVLAGCTTGPHPVNTSTPSDGKDSGKVSATTTGPHPSAK